MTALPDDQHRDDGERQRALPSFWLLHAGGWFAYGVAMTLSRLGIFPLPFMVVAKGLLMASGFVLSLALRQAYRPLIRRSTPLLTLIVVAVVASYVVSRAWTALDNLRAPPVYTAVGLRPPAYRSVLQLFNGTVYNAFTMLAWSVLYIGIRYYVALQAERERSLRAEAAAHRSQLEALRYQINPHFLTGWSSRFRLVRRGPGVRRPLRPRPPASPRSPAPAAGGSGHRLRRAARGVRFQS